MRQEGGNTVYPAVVIQTTAAAFNIEADTQSSVFCNRQLIFTYRDLLRSVLSCYCTYYVLDIQYPATLASFFFFLDRFVFNIATKATSKIPSLCQKVANKLMAWMLRWYAFHSSVLAVAFCWHVFQLCVTCSFISQTVLKHVTDLFVV